MKHQVIGNHLEIHPGVCGGRLIFRGTRMPVELVLHRLANGGTIEEVLAAWPSTTREGVEEAVRLAAMALVDITGARPWNIEHDLPRPWKKVVRWKKATAKLTE